MVTRFSVEESLFEQLLSDHFAACFMVCRVASQSAITWYVFGIRKVVEPMGLLWGINMISAEKHEKHWFVHQHVVWAVMHKGFECIISARVLG